MKKKLLFIFSLSVYCCILSCYRVKLSHGGGQVKVVKPREVNPADIAIPPGLKIEAVSQGLTFPTGIAFDDSGTPFVIESGYSYGEKWTTPRLLRLEPDGKTSVIAEGSDNGPWNGIWYDNDYFFISEGGTKHGGKILKISKSGEITILIENLPTIGDHHTNGPAVKDGYVYFGQGSATNSAVTGTDNADFGWLHRFPEFHDIPCNDIVLNGVNFRSSNPLTENTTDEAITGAYSPFGTSTTDGQVIAGKVPCTGAVLRVPVTGGTPELVAWGFRNPYGLTFGTDGKLFVTDNGYDARGNRPIWGAGDLLMEVNQGDWFGWPDYSAGRAVFGREEFKTPGCERAVRLLKTDPAVPKKSLVELGVHSSSDGLDIIRNPVFGKPGRILIAQFGDQAPAVGKSWRPVGFQVVSVDTQTGVTDIFAANNVKKPGPATYVKNKGLERPLAVKFNPAGDALYIVDFGILQIDKKKHNHPKEKTGVIWKITKQ